MTQAVEPPIPLPPAITPTPKETFSQVAGLFTVISGLVMFVGSFITAFYVTSYGTTIATYRLSDTPDGPLFIVAGMLVIGFGMSRYMTGHRSFQILAILTATGTLLMDLSDAGTVNLNAARVIANTGWTFVFGPAFTLIAIAALGAIVSAACQERAPRRPRTPREAPVRKKVSEDWSDDTLHRVLIGLVVVAVFVVGFGLFAIFI